MFIRMHDTKVLINHGYLVSDLHMERILKIGEFLLFFKLSKIHIFNRSPRISQQYDSSRIRIVARIHTFILRLIHFKSLQVNASYLRYFAA